MDGLLDKNVLTLVLEHAERKKLSKETLVVVLCGFIGNQVATDPFIIDKLKEYLEDDELE